MINTLLSRTPRDERGAPGTPLSESDKTLMTVAALAPEGAFSHFHLSDLGLTEEKVLELRTVHGANEIGKRRRLSFLGEIWERCKNPLVVQLLVIAAVSFAMKDYRSTVVVGAMVFLSVILAYVQETRSNKAAEKLQAMVKTMSLVVRDGKEIPVPIAELVPGDTVILAAGSIIPADLRILTAKDFFVSQSALTGESMPLEKSAAAVDTTGKTILELSNICFMGSNALSGTARGVVVNTGMQTFFGSISKKLAAQRVETSFDKGLKSFTWLMIRFMVVMVALVFLILGFTKHQWLEALLFGLAIAVGLTPEMLPMIVTVNLGKGALEMSRKKVIVKRLNSIQNFGAMDVLCTDKTGTLTQDRVVLERYVDVANRPSDDVLRYAYMNSYYQTGLRNILDKAVLSHSDLDVKKACRKVDEIPFDFSRRRMSVVIDYEEDHVMISKGAVEEIFAVCDRYQIDETVFPLLDMLKHDLLEEYQALSADGYRVLAVAYREFPRTKEVFSPADEKDLILLGYLAFFDPPKESAHRALRVMNHVGIQTKILTGDNELVTRKVCAEVGLPIEGIMTGAELAKLSDSELTLAAEKNTVFARLTPAQKEQLIRALHRGGHVVGFMGDGINDAPAMKAADVGISVDTAVDIAKESADIILLEKNLLVLEDGVLEGRKVFGNITKYIKMGASSNFGNMLSLLGSSLFLPFLPMAPIQVLVNNLLYDISQVGIPTDRVDEEYLRLPRQWNIESIKKFMMFIGPMSSIFDYSTFALMLFVFGCWKFKDPSTPAELKTHYEALFHTGWFVESLLTQTLIVHIIRTRRIPFFQSRASMALTLTTLSVMGVAVYLPYSPLAGYLGLVALPRSYWIWIAATLVTYSILTHQVKAWFIRTYGSD